MRKILSIILYGMACFTVGVYFNRYFAMSIIEQLEERYWVQRMEIGRLRELVGSDRLI